MRIITPKKVVKLFVKQALLAIDEQLRSGRRIIKCEDRWLDILDVIKKECEKSGWLVDIRSIDNPPSKFLRFKDES